MGWELGDPQRPRSSRFTPRRHRAAALRAPTAHTLGETHTQRAAQPRGGARKPVLFTAGHSHLTPSGCVFTPRTHPDAQLQSGTHTPDAQLTPSRCPGLQSLAQARSALTTAQLTPGTEQGSDSEHAQLARGPHPAPRSAGCLQGTLWAELRSAHPEVPDMLAPLPDAHPPGPSGPAGRAAMRRSRLPRFLRHPDSCHLLL